MRRCRILLALLAACGGSPPVAKSADKAPVDVSIGDTAVANGGLSALSHPQGATGTAPMTLRATLVEADAKVHLDGTLGEWPARTSGRVVVKGSGDRVGFSVAIQYDDARLYIGAEVKDDSFFRTERFQTGEDHASLVLAFPSGVPGAFAAYEVGLFAGKPGETEGEVRWQGARHGQIPGAKIVEAPASGGYTFEAQVPWSAFPEARATRVGLRGLARYYDSDGAATARNIVATSEGDASKPVDLPALLTEPEVALLEEFLEPKGLAAATPKFDLFADVAGDALKERISIYDRFFTVCGPGYRHGKEFFFRDLGADVVGLEARDVTGRGKSDVLLRRRFTGQGATREWFEVWSFLGGDEPVATFAHEVAITLGDRRVEDAVHVGNREIDVTLEGAAGWDASSYKEPVSSDAEPVLLPWGTVKSQSYRFVASHFKKTKEVTQAGVAPQAEASTGATPSNRPEEPTTPPERAGRHVSGSAGAWSTPDGDLSRQVFDQYRKDHGVPDGAKPKVDLQVNVDGDGKPERVVLMGKDIVVFGPGFAGGNQYAFLTLQQFADPLDIESLTARDLTGDGAADLVVRGVRHVSASATPAAVDVEGMFVYQVKGASITRVFAIETARAQGNKRVQGLVQFVPGKDGKTFEIDVRPGRAVGWNASSFPWAEEQPGSSAMEPLLLPWGKIPSLRYAWDGTQFSRSRS